MPMPRAITALVVTIVVVVLLAGFKTTPHGQRGRLVSLPHVAAAPKRKPKPKPQQRPASTTAAAAKAKPAHATSTHFTGPAVQTPYGIVQVAVTVRSGRLVNVRPLALPNDQGHSQELSSLAAPILRQEALQAQSAQVNVVSGATYTSEGYAQSLQAALGQAGVRP
jgi:uncharacterized protein with FMN-binding domain